MDLVRKAFKNKERFIARSLYDRLVQVPDRNDKNIFKFVINSFREGNFYSSSLIIMSVVLYLYIYIVLIILS